MQMIFLVKHRDREFFRDRIVDLTQEILEQSSIPHPLAVPEFGVSKFCGSLQQEVRFLIPTGYMALFEVMCYFPNGKYTGNMESMGIHSFFEGGP